LQAEHPAEHNISAVDEVLEELEELREDEGIED
jgi:hypothetical protein